MRTHRKTAIAALSALVLLIGGFITIRPAQSGPDATALIAHTPGVAAPAKNTVVTSNGDLSSAGIVRIPRAAGQGITIGNNQNALKIGLPDTSQLSAGTIDQRDMMTYRSGDGTSDAVIPTTDGAQFLKVLGNAAAFTTFSYPVKIPAGGRLALVTNGPDGQNHSGSGVLIFNAKGAVIGTVSTPWAHDAAGKTLPTYFTVSGDTLTQHVTTQANTTYPVVADPYFRWYSLGVVITMTYSDMVSIAAGGIMAANAILIGSLPTGVGIFGAAAINGVILAVAGGASWGVATHNCLWFWLPYPFVWDVPSHGYYSCH